MIDLYTWFTPNGRKISIMLEEIGLDYEVHAINIGKGEQHDPKFIEISPNNKIPAILDRDNGLKLMESGAILQYLAKKSGQLMPEEDSEYWNMQQWLMFQKASVGPMFGQVHTFVKYGESKNQEASERYLKECQRLYGVMNKHLEDKEYFVANTYTIVDIAIFPWVGRHDWQTINLNDYPNVAEWYVNLTKRPAVQRGWKVPENDQQLPMP
tara:strand:+ start:1146 stop:1778 length:633 start_codon:yes stop_codon:yes gene_type:complete